MIVRVTRPFVGHGYNMPNPGDLIDPPESTARELLSIGVVERYEMKVDKLPAEVKKNEHSESLPAAPARPKPTRKSSRKSATKS